jgi:hypothetical protein
MLQYTVRKLVHTAFVALGVVTLVFVALDLMEQARYTLDQGKRKQLYSEATQIIHDEKPYLELFQDVVIYGVSPRVSFKPRADYRLIAAEISLGGR